MTGMRYTLRYMATAPLQPRPHEPTVARFDTYAEAAAHLESQPSHLMLEVVKR